MINYRCCLYKVKNFINSNVFFFILLFIVVFSIYGKSINYKFLNLDDVRLISGNINFISDIKNLPKIFTTGCFYIKNADDSYYRPILSLSFVLESLLFGENSKVSHTTNVILFVLSIYLMYVFLLKLQLNKYILKFIILLLAVHPILTSVSVWISGRNDSLLTIFVIMSFINILEYLQSCKFKNLALAVLFFAISLFTKESAMILLIIMPILLLSINKFKFKKLLSLYFGFSFPIIAYFFLRSFSNVDSAFLFQLNTYSVFFKNAIYGFIIYISTFLTPIDTPICLFDFSPDLLSILKAVIFVAFIIFIYYKNFVDRKFIILGLSLFVLYLLPTFATSKIFFHRFLLPSLGIVLILFLFTHKIIEKYPISKKYFLSSFIVLFLFLSYNSYLQADKYENNEIFTIEGYKSAPTYYHFLVNMGAMYIEKQNYDKALEFMFLAEKYSPGQGLIGIASVFYYQNDFEQAEAFLKKAIEINENKENAYVNLSLIYEEKQDYEKSLELAKKAYDENPYNVELSINLARKYLLNERYKEAIDIYLKLLELKKTESGYYYSIAFLYDKLGNKEKALDFAKKAIELNDNNEKYKQFLSRLSVN